jgi:hypothetical protein
MRQVALAVVVAAALAGPGRAQESALTEEARRLAAGAGADVRAWSEGNLAENARILASGVVLGPPARWRATTSSRGARRSCASPG